MIYLVPTPIGNLADISARALEVLAKADILACEDTRRTRALLSHFNISRPARVVSYREQNEERTAEYLVSESLAGKRVVVCSDSGFPAISDPGYRVVSEAVEKNAEFTVLPGASAVQVALAMSGLPTSSYLFKGYPPKKSGRLRTFFEEEKEAAHTLVFFESPMRVNKALEAVLDVMGDRKSAVCVELTKKFERVYRGYVSDLISELPPTGIKGEVTIVVAGNNPKFIREQLS